MFELIIGFTLGIIITAAAPRLKKILIFIVNRFFDKADKEANRWFSKDKNKD